jgi:hypothetical protein
MLMKKWSVRHVEWLDFYLEIIYSYSTAHPYKSVDVRSLSFIRGMSKCIIFISMLWTCLVWRSFINRTTVCTCISKIIFLVAELACSDCRYSPQRLKTCPLSVVPPQHVSSHLLKKVLFLCFLNLETELWYGLKETSVRGESKGCAVT